MRSGVHGSGLLAVTVDSGNADVPISDMEPVEIKRRFMRGDIGGLRFTFSTSLDLSSFMWRLPPP